MKAKSLFIALICVLGSCLGQDVTAAPVLDEDRGVDCTVSAIRKNGRVVGDFARLDRFAAALPRTAQVADEPGRVFRFGIGRIDLIRDIPPGPLTDGAVITAAVAVEVSGPRDGIKWVKGTLSLSNPFPSGVEVQKIDYQVEATRSFHYLRQQVYRKDSGSAPLGGLIGIELFCNFTK